MAFEDNFRSNMAINKDIIPMQHLSRSKACAKAKLVAEVHRDLGLEELDLSMNLKCLEFGLLDYEQVKSPIPNMDYENNHMGNESKSCKNRGKRG